VSVIRPRRRTSLLLWFALLAPPALWAIEFFLGQALVDTSCRQAGRTWGIHVNGVTIAMAASTALVTLLAWGAAFTLFRATREAEDDDAPPDGRVKFLATVALLTTPLFFLIIVMSAIAAVVLPDCRQS
jgi:hypothetical protein